MQLKIVYVVTERYLIILLLSTAVRGSSGFSVITRPTRPTIWTWRLYPMKIACSSPFFHKYPFDFFILFRMANTH